MSRTDLKIASLLLGSLLTLAAPALGQGADLSFPEMLTSLEQRLSLPPQNNAPLLWRLDRAESTAYGSTRGGPISTRIQGLKEFIESRQLAPQAPPAQQQQIQQTQMQPMQTQQMAPPQQTALPQQVQLPIPQATSTSGAPESLGADKVSKIQSLVKQAEIGKIVPVQNTSPPHFFRITPSNEPLAQTDYLDAVLTASKNRTFRFSSMPIPVYITPLSDNSLVRAARESFFDWESRGAKVKFVESDEKSARIKVVWSRLGSSSDSNDCTLGAHTITKWTKHPSGQLSVMSISAIPIPVYIPRLGAKYTVPPQVIEVNLDLIYSKMPESRYLLCKNILAHELGHALGMLGHSPDKGDLMYSVTDEYSRLSQRDLNTLQKLYERKVDVPL